LRKAYIVNTNRTNRPNGEDELDMVTKQKCAAYFSPWKESIEAINPNDLVFLYRNQVGIIARGIATGVPELADYTNEDGFHQYEQVYMHLDRFEVLDIPMPAGVINEIVGYSVVYGQTRVSMNYEGALKIWRSITKQHIEQKEQSLS
jgi:hypothetical protein